MTLLLCRVVPCNVMNAHCCFFFSAAKDMPHATCHMP